MRRWPHVSAALLLGGCYLAHEPASEDAAPAAHDAGRATLDAGPAPRFDSGPGAGRDAGADAGPGPARDAGTDACGDPLPPGRTNGFCVLDPSGAIRPETPRPLLIWHDGCFCDDALTCAPHSDGDHIDLSTTICRDPDGCERCAPAIQTICTLPPLARGTYTVSIDGLDLGQVRVADPGAAGPSARPICYVTPDPSHDAATTCSERVALARGSRVCRPEVTDVGQQPTITVHDTCAGCFDRSGGCSVALEPGQLVIEPGRLSCDCATCGDCGPSCTELAVECRPPPLAAGSYALVVAGRATGAHLVVRDILPSPSPARVICDDF